MFMRIASGSTSARTALLAAALALLQAPAAAGSYLNRSGTLVHEDDPPSRGDGSEWWALAGLAVLTFALYKGFQIKWPKHSDALNFNLAWLTALALWVVGLVVLR